MFKTLKDEMTRQGISGYRLAQLTGISAPDIYKLLSGKVYCYRGWRRRIAEALGCSVDELFPDEKGGDAR